MTRPLAPSSDTGPSRRDHRFDHAGVLAEALAAAVAGNLRGAIAARRSALLGLSGGSTPRRFLVALARQALDWSRVTVVPVDERWVAPDDPRSNERMLRELLLRDEAASARLVSLVSDQPDPERALPAIAARVASLRMPFDAIVLGMGDDGHCASLFPQGDHLAEALDPHAFARVLPMRAPAAPEPRVTLTLPVLAGALSLYVHIEGARKLAVFESAMHAGNVPALPIAAVLSHAGAPVNVYWAPDGVAPGAIHET